MKVSGYSGQRVLLHWLSAAVILWTLVTGFYVASVDVTARVANWVSFVNVSLTTLFIPFFVWRLALFVVHTRSARVKALPSAELFAWGAHALIYASVSVVLLSGVLMMDRPINVFGAFRIPQLLHDPALIEQFFTLHIWACVVLLWLVIGHIGAVIVHEWCGHRILRRMAWRPRGTRAFNPCE